VAAKKKTKAKKSAKKRASKKSTRKAGNANHLSFLGEGGRTIMGWLGALVIGIGSVFTWMARRTWEALHGQRGRQPLGLMLVALSIFALVALISYAAGDPGSNWSGKIGHTLADGLLRFFGYGAYLIPAFGIFWGFARLLRQSEGSSALLKLVGVLVLAITVSLSARGLTGAPEGTVLLVNGPGGWFGNRFYPNIRGALGQFGVVTLLVLLGGLSSLFATEWAFVPLIRDLARKGRESLRQPNLPLQPERPSLREQTKLNHEKASQGVKGFWHKFIRLLSPFHPPGEEEKQAQARAAQAQAAQAQDAQEQANGQASAAQSAQAGRPSRLDTIPAIMQGQTLLEEEGVPEPLPVKKSKRQAAKEAAAANAAAEDEVRRAQQAEAAARKQAAQAERPKVSAASAASAGVSAERLADLEAGSGSVSLPGISEAPEEQHHALDFDKESSKPRRKKPRLDSLPDPAVLERGETVDRSKAQAEIDSLGSRLQDVFDAFGLDGRVVGAERGPTLTLFEVKLAAGVSVKKLNSQRDDLGVALGSHGVRIVYPLPGRTTVGIEVPNLKRDPVRLKDVYDGADLSWEKVRLPMVLGRDTLGKQAVEDLAKMPHMLIAGTTGSGKSVCLNSILLTMLLRRTPEQVRMVLIDPKQVELQLYQDIPHLLCPVVTDMKRAPFTLEWAVRAMEDRLHQFKLAGVRNINDYNALKPAELMKRVGEAYDPEEFPDTIPYFVLVIDELADLMMVSKKEVEIAISRLAAKARAAGIHLLVATQRPSTDVVTGLIKMNLPVRMAFRVTSLVDSRVILDEGGAEALLGNGDFLYRPPGASGMTRGQGAFVSEEEVRKICDHLRENGKPEFLEDLVQMKGPAGGSSEVDDPLYDDAVRIILQSGRGSASLLQRALSVGYTRASRLIDIMTEQGVLGPFVGSKAREVQLTLEEWEAQQDSN
jgi:DNA segregation ATPase FtsK/SpoIIIE, S-DNA-T family